MPNLNITTYQYSDGSYDLDDAGDKIPVETITASFDWSGASAVSGPPVRKVSSFDIIDDGDSFTTRVNKSRRVGSFLSSTTAVGALVGTFFGSGVGSVSAVEAIMSDQLSRGVSSLDAVPADTPTGLKKSSPASFAYGHPNDQSDAFYNSGALDRASGVRPDDVMPDVLTSMAVPSPGCITMYVDNATEITDGWHSFDVDAWDGVSALPQMDPLEYLSYLDSLVADRGINPSSAQNVLVDWEAGTTETGRKGAIYWNDPATTKYRDALLALRSQQAAVYDMMKTAYPNFGFGMYGGVVGYGQFDGLWDSTNKIWTSAGAQISNPTGTRWYSTLKGDADKLSNLMQNISDCVTATPGPWDFNTVVCYNYFTQDAFDVFAANPSGDKTAYKPSYAQEENLWTISTLKSLTTAPVYAIVSPTAYNNSTFGVPANTADYAYWSDNNNWIEQTLASIDGADGYLIWEGLRSQAFKSWCSPFADWSAVSSTYQTQYTKEWSLFEDLEAKFNFLTEFAEKWNVAIPTSAEEWFNQDVSIRNNDWTENLLVGRTSKDLLVRLIPTIQEWRTTGNLPATVSQDLGTILVFSPGAFSQLTATEEFWHVLNPNLPGDSLPLSIIGAPSGGPYLNVASQGGSAWEPDPRIQNGDLFRFVVNGQYITAPVTVTNTSATFSKPELIEALTATGATLDRFYKLEPFNEVSTKQQKRVQRKRARIKTKNARSYDRISSLRLKMQAVNDWVVSHSPKRQARQATVLQRLRNRISHIYSKVTYRLGRW